MSNLSSVPHLYITDLDGTLLRSDATLSEYSRLTLNRLIEEGLLFSVATARGIHRILKGCNIQLPVIEFNGAYISDFVTGEHLTTNAIEPELSKEVYGLMKEYHGDPFVTTNDGNDHLFYRSLSSQGMQEYYRDRVDILDKRLKQVDDLESKLRHQVLCLTVINTKDVLLPLYERLVGE
jgi:5-amino-6-(5-phospho-D-ribitylamino)uracil phosphatase